MRNILIVFCLLTVGISGCVKLNNQEELVSATPLINNMKSADGPKKLNKSMALTSEDKSFWAKTNDTFKQAGTRSAVDKAAMKSTKNPPIFYWSGLALVASEMDLATNDPNYNKALVDNIKITQRRVDKVLSPPSLGMKSAEKNVNEKYWPEPMYQVGLNKTIVKMMMSAIKGNTASEEVTITSSDVEDFALKSIKLFGLPGRHSAYAAAQPIEKNIVNASPGQADKTSNLFLAYLIAYNKGKFVTRSGVELARPKTKGGIGNESIKAILTILLEATYDSLVDLPVFCINDGENPKWINSSGKKPTAVVINKNLKLDVVPTLEKKDQKITSSKNSITDVEAYAIQIIGNIAGDQSEHLTGLVLRSLGDVELAFVVGAHFSIGDNNTLAAVCDTLTESIMTRIAQIEAYQYFLNNDVEVGEPSINFLRMVRSVLQLLLEEEKKEKTKES